MRCPEAIAAIPDYADGTLDARTSAAVRAHIEKCAACAAELEAFRAYRSAMSGLPRVKAPADFMERLHERLGVAPARRGLLERIFLPLKIKIPLEAAGLAAVCAVAVLFFDPFEFRRPAPSYRTAESPGASEAVIEKDTRGSAGTLRRKGPSRPMEKKAPFSVARDEDRADGLQEKEAGGAGISRSKRPDKSASIEDMPAEYQEIALVFGGSPGGDMERSESKKREGASGMADSKISAESKDLARQRKLKKEERFQSPAAAGKACERVVSIAASVKGRVLRTDARDGLCKTVILEVPVENYGRFMELMKGIGGQDIRRSEKALKKKQVPVRVEIIER